MNFRPKAEINQVIATKVAMLSYSDVYGEIGWRDAHGNFVCATQEPPDYLENMEVLIDLISSIEITMFCLPNDDLKWGCTVWERPRFDSPDFKAETLPKAVCGALLKSVGEDIFNS